MTWSFCKTDISWNIGKEYLFAKEFLIYEPTSKGAEAYLSLAEEFLDRNKIKYKPFTSDTKITVYSLITAGTLVSPASLEALQRLSPAMMRYLSSASLLRTTSDTKIKLREVKD